MTLVADPFFRVHTLVATPNPQTITWLGLHQDYSGESVIYATPPNEKEAGEAAVRALLAGDRGHYGPLEHPQITLAAANFPHCVMQQARTHRVGISFDVQSFRYTGELIVEAVSRIKNIWLNKDLTAAEQQRASNNEIEQYFYLRPVGEYTNRQGAKYFYNTRSRESDLALIYNCMERYAYRVSEGCPEEQARSILPFDYRQHFVVSFNLRSALHFLDLRAKKDAQWEIRQLSELIHANLQLWAPELTNWYTKTRLGKARLAP